MLASGAIPTQLSAKPGRFLRIPRELDSHHEALILFARLRTTSVARSAVEKRAARSAARQARHSTNPVFAAATAARPR